MTRRVNRLIKVERRRVEAAISRLKRRRILNEDYRHPLTNHLLCWGVAVYIYNMDVVLLTKDKK